MKLTFNSNSIKTLMAYRRNAVAHSKTINNISTGKKINGAKDDPNRISKVSNFEKEIRGFQRSRNNLQDAVSMVQSADSAMGSINERVTRLRELTLSIHNGSMEDDEIAVVQNEANTILESIEYDVKEFSFNGKNIIGDKSITDNTNPSKVEVLSTGNAGDFTEIPVFNLSLKNLGLENLNMKDDIDKNLEKIDNAATQVINARTKLGAINTTLDAKIDQSQSIEDVVTGAKSKIEDADVALEMMEFTRTLVLNEANIKNMSKTIYLPNDIINTLGKLYK